MSEFASVQMRWRVQGSMPRWIPHYWSGRHHFPQNKPFKWIVPDVLGVSCWPDDQHFAKEYPENGVTVVINVSEFDNPDGVPAGYAYYHLPIPDYGVPSEKQVENFIQLVNKHSSRGERVVVHCVAGCGRTGQMVAIWAASTGRIPAGQDPVTWVRKRRPCSCETHQQEEKVRKMVRKFQKT